MNLKTILLCTTFAVMPVVRADFVGIYDYFTSLGGTYAAQTGNEKWTFHNGDQDGALMGVYAGAGYGNVGAYAQFTSPGAAGTLAPGSAGTNEAAGIFTHTAASGYISAVFHADSSFTAESILFTHELVGNGNWGNGIDLSLRTVVGGNVVDHGSFAITNILSAQTAYNFGVSGLTFNAGDEIVVTFSARGNYLYDHGWWDIDLQKLTGQNGNTGAPVPDNGNTSILTAMGLIVLGAIRRQKPPAACPV